jgi:hypothetical protein
MQWGASFDADQARRQLLEKREDVTPLQLPANDHLVGNINAMHLKTRLRDVETDCSDRLHLAPLNRGSSSNSHFHGTHVPVEEPSTASKGDMEGLFDHLVGASEQ